MDKKSPLINLGDYINGEFVVPTKPSGSFESINPSFTKDIVYQGQFQFDHVNSAALSARKAFANWGHASFEVRAGFVKLLREALIANVEELAALVCREVGKPLWEARSEIQATIKNIDVHLEYSHRLVKTFEVPEVGEFESKLNLKGEVSYKPRGVMAVLAPFNFPVYVPFEHFIPALLTGNTVVLKPSEFAPAVGQKIAQLIEQARFPAGTFNLLQGPQDVGRRLVMHETVEGILFSGSYESSYRIKQDVLPHFWKITALETGGKNAAIVSSDCDLERALSENLIGAFITSGQRCTSTSRILVHKKILNQFVDRFHAASKKVQIGKADTDPFMGPLISQSSVEKYLRFQGIAQREGCESIMRGKTLESPQFGFFVTPSIYVVSKPDPASVYQKTELLGPNVAIYPYEELEEAVSVVNQSSYGLVVSIFSKSKNEFEKVRQLSRAGVINHNLSTIRTNPYLPFGGMGKSGTNQPTGAYAVFYSTYPVASLEDQSLDYHQKEIPGFFHP